MTNIKQIRSDVAGPLLFHGTRHVESSTDLSWDGSILGIVGGISVSDLSGSGTRMVVSDASGLLSTQPIPTSAALIDTFIGVGNSSNLLGGSNKFTYNGTRFYVATPTTDDEVVASIGGFTFTERLSGFTGRQSLTFGALTIGNPADQPYITGNGLGLASGTDIYIQPAGTAIFYTGNVQMNYMSGSGTRMVVADSNGVLSTQTITVGTITSVSGTTNQIIASTVSGAVTLSLPSNPHIAGTLFVGSTAGIQWGDNGIAGSINGFLTAAGDGIFRFGDSAGGGSPRIILGSISATQGIAFQRNGATFEIRKGDNSGYADITALGAKITSLAGSGTRMVVTDAAGTLSTQTLPTDPIISLKEIVYGTGTGITSQPAFSIYDANGIKRINIGSVTEVGQIDFSGTGGIFLRIEGGLDAYFTQSSGGFVFRPDFAETFRLTTAAAIFSSIARINTNGAQLYVNSLNNSAGKIVFQDSGVTHGLIGGDADTTFGVVDPQGQYQFFIKSTGEAVIPDLAGSGTRMVVSDLNGMLSTQTIPSGATLTNTYVGVGDSSNLLSGSVNLRFTSAGNIYNLDIAQGGLNLGFNGNANSSYILGLGSIFNIYSVNQSANIGLSINGNMSLTAADITSSATYFIINNAGILPTDLGTRLDSVGLRIGQQSTLTSTNNYIFQTGATFYNEAGGRRWWDFDTYGQIGFDGSGMIFNASGSVVLNIVQQNSGQYLRLNSSEIEYNGLAHHFTTGDVTVDSLSGSGTRMVVADTNGLLSTQVIPSAALQETYIGVGDSNNELSGSSDFTYDGSTLYLDPYKKFLVSGLKFDGFNAGRIYSTTEEAFLVLSGQTALWGSYSTSMQLTQNQILFNVANVQKLDMNPFTADFKGNILVTNKRSTIGGTFYAENNSFNLAGDGPIVASDNMGGRKIGLGYSPTATDYIWSAFDGMYIYGHGRYNVFIYSNGFNNAGLHVEGKFRVGDTNFNTGHTAEIVGDLQVTDQGGTGIRLVEADSTGVQSATKEIISAWVNDLTAITELEDPTNWDVAGQWLGSITNTYRGQEHYDSNYFYKMVRDDEPIRMIRG